MGKAFDIVGYTGDADIYCVPCAKKRFDDLDGDDTEGNPIAPLFDDMATREDTCSDCMEYILEIHGDHRS